jgi:alpha-beta hydrolase superfamily lysophospholipase
MEHFEYHWKAPDGLQLYGQGWAPETEAKGVISLVHGLGEHSGRYSHLAQAVTASGYALVTFDLRGHGKSEGQRGHTPSHEQLYRDIDRLLVESSSRFPGLPSFLYGHSLGGNLVLNYTLRRQPRLSGVIATGPWLEVAFKPPRWKLALGRVMNVIYPSFSSPNGLIPEDLCHDPTVVRAYKNDALVHDRVSARLGIEALQNGAWALEHAAEFPLPLLLMHGGSDRITSGPASQEFARRVGSLCTLKIWDGLWHELQNEYEQGEVFAFLLNWLDGRSQSEAGRVSEKYLP